MGDRDSVLGFIALGLEVCPVADGEEGRRALHRMAKEDYAIIYMTEQLAVQIPNEIEKYKDAYGDIPMFLEDAEKRRKVKEAKRKKSKEIDNFYIEVNSVYPSLDSYDERYYKKNVCFNYLLFEDDFSCLYEFGKELRKKGATIVRNPLDADYIIIRPHTVLSNTTKTKENVQIIRLDTLRKQLKKE